MWLSVSTHSHPKVAAHNHNKLIALFKFQHTATRRWLQPTTGEPKRQKKFQHTATRRWLHLPLSMDCLNKHVSTHSHPKVAATAALHTHIITKFQHTATRRWLHNILRSKMLISISFNTQPPEGGCPQTRLIFPKYECFNTQPPEGGCWR